MGALDFAMTTEGGSLTIFTNFHRCMLILPSDSKSRAVAMRGTFRCCESESLLDMFEPLQKWRSCPLSDICAFEHAALGGFERLEGMAKDTTFLMLQ